MKRPIKKGTLKKLAAVRKAAEARAAAIAAIPAEELETKKRRANR